MTELLQPTEEAIRRATDLLLLGGVIALPTETVYGLAAWIEKSHGIDQIFIAKDRPRFDPLIVHLASPLNRKAPFSEYVQDGLLSPQWSDGLDPAALTRLVLQAWPGPLTLLLPKGPLVSDSVTAGSPKVAIRSPAHPVFQAVLDSMSTRIGRTAMLAAPSANRFGHLSPTTALHVSTELAGRIPLILDGGACTIGVESTILEPLDGRRYRIRRPGGFAQAALEKILQAPVECAPWSAKTSGYQTSNMQPGELQSHYAPRKPLEIATPERWKQELIHPKKQTGYLSFFGPQSNLASHFKVLSPNHAWEKVAENLYSQLRELDEDSDVTEICCEPIPDEPASGIRLAILDRLSRAQGPSKRRP